MKQATQIAVLVGCVRSVGLDVSVTLSVTTMETVVVILNILACHKMKVSHNNIVPV